MASTRWKTGTPVAAEGYKDRARDGGQLGLSQADTGSKLRRGILSSTALVRRIPSPPLSLRGQSTTRFTR